jgi:transcriptional regulator with XRE-family HTH domain
VPDGSTLERFAANLRRIRLLEGMDQKTLAREAGIHKSSVSLYEAAKVCPWPSTVFRLADALFCEPRDLWGL